MSMFDSHYLPIECPSCGVKTKQSIGWLKSNDHFTCACGATVRFDAGQLIEGTKKADDLLRKMKQSPKVFKTR